MKISIALSIVILALAAAFGWRGNQQLATVREAHSHLVAEAATLGIAADPATETGRTRVTKRGERADKEAEARLVAKEFIAFAKEMEALEKNGGKRDDTVQKRIMEVLDRLMSLDGKQLKFLIAEVRATPDLKDETRKGLIGFSIMSLSSEHPQTALILLTESADILGADGMAQHVTNSSLGAWAKKDPAAALAWVRENGAKFPDLVTEDAKRGLIQGAAVNDPKLAFKLIGELGLQDPKDASRNIAGIIGAAKTPEARTTTLAAVRDYLTTISDEKTRDQTQREAMRDMAGLMSQGDFSTSTGWIENAKLNPTELANFAEGLDINSQSGETGRWIEWVGEKIPPEKSRSSIHNMVRNWTNKDYQAAGKWLAGFENGPVKNIAVSTYAETVSRYEPEAGAQWAATLPPGEERDQTLKQIYENWPTKDDASKAAAEAFKAQHGIK